MKSPVLNLFIVDDNILVVNGLRNHLTARFGNGINITTFLSGKGALEKITADIHMVILDYALEGENGNDVLKSIKTKYPATEVVMLSSNNEMEVAINSFRNGATDFVLKGRNSWSKITSLVYDAITYPVRKLVQEFGINKYLAMFILTFVAMGIGVIFSLKYMN